MDEIDITGRYWTDGFIAGAVVGVAAGAFMSVLVVLLTGV